MDCSCAALGARPLGEMFEIARSAARRRKVPYVSSVIYYPHYTELDVDQPREWTDKNSVNGCYGLSEKDHRHCYPTLGLPFSVMVDFSRSVGQTLQTMGLARPGWLSSRPDRWINPYSDVRSAWVTPAAAKVLRQDKIPE